MVYATLRQHKDDKKDGKNLKGTLNGIQRAVYDCIKANPGIQAQNIINEYGIPRDTLNKVVKVLMKINLVERRGGKKAGGYYITSI